MTRTDRLIKQLGPVVLLVANVGCPDQPPEEPYMYTMEVGERRLTPPGYTRGDAKILEGTAQVIGLESRGALPAATPVEPEPPAAGSTDDPLAALATMIADYNKAIREKRTEDIVGFVHPDVQGRLRALLPLHACLSDLTQVMESTQPGSAGIVGAVLSQMSLESQELDAENLTMTGENSATGTDSAAGMQIPVEFERVNGRWYRADLQVTTLAPDQLKPIVDEACGEFNSLSAGVKDGSIPILQATLQMTQAFTKLGAALRGTTPAGTAAPPPIK